MSVELIGDPNDRSLSESQVVFITITIGIDIIIFSVFLFFTMKNVRNFVIKQEKYKNILVLAFYFFSLTILISRMLEFIFAYYLAEYEKFRLEVNYAIITAIAAKLSLGYFQAVSMIEIVIRIRSNVPSTRADS
jgi:hypothetical protein